MLIKVCGMRSEEQVREIEKSVDFIGFIFYEGSKRFVESSPALGHARKVGVFVNATIDEILGHIEEHQLDLVQLHGNESPEMCAELKSSIPVIKAFGIDSDFDFAQTNAYSPHVDYFLFDTKTPLHGGSGKQFDWSLLNQYTGTTPFFLSGGITLDAVRSIKNINHPKLVGVDVNSGFESAPAEKNVSELRQFIQKIRS